MPAVGIKTEVKIATFVEEICVMLMGLIRKGGAGVATVSNTLPVSPTGGVFPPSHCVTRCSRLPLFVATKGQEKSNVLGTRRQMTTVE
jgi:hypothetical protein